MAIKDLPDYQKKIVIVTVPGVYPAEMQVDHRKILGVALKSPYVAASIPSSIENPALAYDSVNDRFKVDIEDATGVTFTSDISDKWARQLGQIDLQRVLGASLAHNNPIIVRLTDGTAFIDPRSIRALTSSDIVKAYGSQTQALLQRATTYDLLIQLRNAGVEIDPRDRNWSLGAGDVPDLSDKATRLVGKIYGNQDVLQQRATTKELIVQIQHQGAEKDPTQIRALTAADIVSAAQSGTWSVGRTWNLGASDIPDLLDRAARLLGKVYGNQDVLQQRATTKELIVQIQHQGAEKDPTQIRALTSSDVITAQQATRTSLKAQTEREDLTSLGGVASPNNAGVGLIAGVAGQKIKLSDASYEGTVDGLHYFYFGTNTTATTRRFMVRNTKGPIAQTFVNPQVSNAGDGLYIFSAVAETNMPYAVHYVQEA